MARLVRIGRAVLQDALVVCVEEPVEDVIAVAVERLEADRARRNAAAAQRLVRRIFRREGLDLALDPTAPVRALARDLAVRMKAPVAPVDLALFVPARPHYPPPPPIIAITA